MQKMSLEDRMRELEKENQVLRETLAQKGEDELDTVLDLVEENKEDVQELFHRLLKHLKVQEKKCRVQQEKIIQHLKLHGFEVPVEFREALDSKMDCNDCKTSKVKVNLAQDIFHKLDEVYKDLLQVKTNLRP